MMEILKKLINRETLLYLVFGVLTTAVDWLVYMLLIRADMAKFIANILAWIAAVIFAFITNKLLVFQSMDRDLLTLLREGAAFVLSRLYTGLFSWGGFYIFVNKLGFHHIAVKALLSVFVIIFNYVLSKLFIFRKKNKARRKCPDGQS
ncbi:MAG: GtrA family protein [Johnsonella sp.]|nr:GtrA family protein [Johnsonella sp.]